MTSTEIAIVVNGETQRVAAPLSVAQLLEQLALRRERLAVELNRAILPRDRYETLLQDGDRLEIVSFVGGG